jgi:hypothetical protein
MESERKRESAAGVLLQSWGKPGALDLEEQNGGGEEAAKDLQSAYLLAWQESIFILLLRTLCCALKPIFYSVCLFVPYWIWISIFCQMHSWQKKKKRKKEKSPIQWASSSTG